MSAINLYVAVDWQGDREIEREREGGCKGRREAQKERKSAGDVKAEKERNSKLRRTKWEVERKETVCVYLTRKGIEREYTQATDIPSFLLIEIQFKRSKPSNSEEIKLSQYYRERTISAFCLYCIYNQEFYTLNHGPATNAREIVISLVANNRKQWNIIFRTFICRK